jgi:hypothetical protein
VSDSTSRDHHGSILLALFVRGYCDAGVFWCPTRVATRLAAGKSSGFASFVLRECVKAGRTTIYVSDKVNAGFVFHSDGRVEAFAKTDFDRFTLDLREDPNNVVIFDGDGDGQKPPICNATTLLVTSPKLARYNAFAREGALDVVFPVFSRMELEDMVQTCFPEQAASGGNGTTPAWVERYEKWGGVPRYVFRLLDVAEQRKVDSAETGMNLDRLADVLNKRDIEDDAILSHRLFHLKPVGEQPDGTFVGGKTREAYVLDRTELGSRYIRKQVFAAMHKSRSNRLLTLLAQPTKGTSLSKF